MSKLQTALVLLVSSFAIAQNAQQAPPEQPKSTQKMPSKSDPQGYSKDMFDDGSKTKTELGRPATYTPPGGSPDKKIPDDLQAVVSAQFEPDFTIAAEK